MPPPSAPENRRQLAGAATAAVHRAAVVLDRRFGPDLAVLAHRLGLTGDPAPGLSRA
jgi:hypothetical protein